MNTMEVMNQNLSNQIQITDMYWDRIYLHVKIEGTGIENYRYALVNRKSGCVYSVKPTGDKNEFVINITNVGNQEMLENGQWHIAYFHSDGNGSLLLSDGTDDKTQEWADIPVSIETCYKMKKMDKVYRYSDDSYAYIVTFMTGKEEDNLICKINCTFMMKDNSPEKRHFSAESSKMSKRWIKRAIYFLEKFINIIYQIVSHLTPKKGNRILLMSETRSMGGNLQALDERLKVRGLDKSFRISYCFSKTLERSKIRILLIWLKLAFMTGRQDFIFVDDYVPFFKYINVHPKTKLIQVWHAGVGFKSVGYARFGEKGSPYPYASSHRKYDYVIVGGEALRDVYAEVFGVDREKCLPYGLMRMDGYLDQDKINRFKEQFYQEYKHLKGKKIILFAPTFRGNGQRNAYYPFEILEQDKIYEMCGTEYVFLIKMHPFVTEKIEIAPEYQERIIDFSAFPDINSLFYVTDILITDYSSNIYEFSVLNKPIIFFAYDKYEYELIRSVHRTLEKNAPGKVCQTLDEVVDAIENQDFELEKLQKFVNENVDNLEGNSCDKVIDNILLAGKPD